MLLHILITLALPPALFAQTKILRIEEGGECKREGGVSWVCTHAQKCPQIGDVRVARHDICSFRGLHPIICCPPPIKIVQSKAITKCNEYRQQLCQGPSTGMLMRRRRGSEINGTSSNQSQRDIIKMIPAIQGGVKHVMGGIHSVPRVHTHMEPRLLPRKKRLIDKKVIGGKRSVPRQQSNMALIGYGKKDNKNWACGGSLISTRFVLSAAHCSETFDGPARWARLGDLDISSITDDASPQDFTIVERNIHPDYSNNLVYSDIALFKLNKDVVFTDWVRPVCLWASPTVTAERATVTGWGRVEFVGATSPHLMEVDLPIVDGATCKEQMGVSKKYPDGINASTMICAGEKEGGKDACLGDSGGPLVVPATANCLKMQIGITSFGKMCGLPDSPGVYTRVSFFLPWIESIVWP